MKIRGIITIIAVLTINLLMGQQKPPVAIDDTVTAYAGSKLYINVLDNDYWMEGHYARIYVISVPPAVATFNDSTIICQTDYDDIGEMCISYVIEDSDNILYSEVATLTIKFINDAYNTLSVNNLNASFNARGNHHRVIDSNEKTDFLIFDNGFQETLIKNMALWIGGMDKHGHLHMAAETSWDEETKDFWMGPVADNYNTGYFNKWSRIWKISREEIEYHKSNWHDPYYQPPNQLATWPGSSDLYKREAEGFAPFFDYNRDGIYKPMDGDYPIIRGDEALYFVYNDDVMGHASGGRKLGVEIRGMAYVYHSPENEALSNAVFLHYEIINKSDTTYEDTYLGVYSSMAVGEEGDDYIECDVMRNTFFGFDGYADTAGVTPEAAFKTCSPTQSITILGGPTVDDERLGMSVFMAYHLDMFHDYCKPPSHANEYYLSMQGFWNDGHRLEYGGKGHPEAGSVGPACNYMLPGDSDPFLFGTAGVMPNEGYTQDGKYWTEIHEEHSPHDISGIASMGPFTFAPGDRHELDLVFVFGQDSTKSGSTHGIPVMKERIDSIRYYYDHHLFPDDDPPYALAEHGEGLESDDLLLYPNPCSSVARLRYLIHDPSTEFILSKAEVLGTGSRYLICDLYSISGRKIRIIMEEEKLPGEHEIEVDVSDLPAGVYFVRLQAGGQIVTKKLIVTE